MAWVRSPVVVDVLCTALVTLPFLTNNICSIGGGVAALRGNNELAAKFTRALCYLWAFYTGFLSLLIMFSGSRLIHLLASYLERRTYLGPAELTKIKLGLVKVNLSTYSLLSPLSSPTVSLFLIAQNHRYYCFCLSCHVFRCVCHLCHMSGKRHAQYERQYRNCLTMDVRR